MLLASHNPFNATQTIAIPLIKSQHCLSELSSWRGKDIWEKEGGVGKPFWGIPCLLEEEMRTLDGGEETEKFLRSLLLVKEGRKRKQSRQLKGNPKCFVKKLLVLAALCPCNEECCTNFSSSCISYSFMILHLLLCCLYHFLFYGINDVWCMQT